MKNRLLSSSAAPRLRALLSMVLALPLIVFSIAIAPSANALTPGAPTIVGWDTRFSSSSGDRLYVYFTAATNVPTNYEYSTDNGTTWKARTDSAGTAITASTSTSISIYVLSSNASAHLSPGVTYQIKVRGVNGTNGVTQGTASSVYAITAGVPSKTGTLTATTGTSQTIGLSFSQPSYYNSGLTYQYSTDNGTTWANKTTSLSGSTVSMSITTTSNDGSSLVNGTAYTVRVRAVNSYGNSTQFTSAAVSTVSATPGAAPSAPQSLSVVPGNASAALTWAAPAQTNGYPITDYVIERATNAIFTSSTSVLLGSAGLNYTFTGLTNGTSYYFRVSAKNAKGTSSTIASSISYKIGAPLEPTNLAITPSSGQLSVAFTAPSSYNASSITNYEYSTNGGSSWTTRSPTSTSSPIVISGLTNNTEYTIAIRAVNTQGSGVSSATIKGTPSSTAIAPSAPTIDTISPGDGQLTVNFIAGSNGGSAITNYQYSLKSGTWTSFSPAVTSTPATITGLTNGTDYDIQIRAVNSVNFGTASNLITKVTPSAVPDAPTSLTAAATNLGFDLSWTAPANNGNSISGYKVEYKVGSGSWTTATANTGTVNTTYSLTGLTAGDSVSIRVSAINARGTGATSTASTAKTVITTPGAPTITSINGFDAQLSVNFTEPGSNGYSAITDYEYSTDGGTTWDAIGSTNNPLVTNTESDGTTTLTNGTTYTVKIRAVNAAGSGTASGSSTGTPSSAPYVIDVTSTTTDGTYKASATISIQVGFSAAVTVTGTPRIQLIVGGNTAYANYSSGSGTSTLTFTYTVQAGDTASDLDYSSTSALTLNSGTIKNASSTNATLVLPNPGSASSLGSGSAIVLDTSAPASSGSITATTTTGTSVSVVYTASDTNGVASITAYYSTNADLSSASSCGSVTSNATSGTITCTIPSTDATYYIYTRATDSVGNIESAPGSADDSIVRNTVPTISIALPSSSHSATYATPVEITATVSQDGNVNFKLDGTSISSCSARASSGGTATCTWTPSAVNASGVLTAVITPTNSAYTTGTSTNYAVNIGKISTLTITADGQSKTYDGSAASAGAYTQSGKASIDTISGLTYTFTNKVGTSSYNSTTPPTNAGSYWITPSSITFSSGSTGNYTTISYVAGTLTISKADPVITWGSISPMVAGNLTSTQLNATGSVDGTISYSTTLGTAINSSLTVTATLTPTDSTNYNTVTKDNFITVSAGAPSAPAKPTLARTGFSDGQLTLTWSISSSNGGASISDYEYRYALNKVGEEPSWSDWQSSGKTDSNKDGSNRITKVVTGLTKGKNYVVQVRAKNSAGYSSTSPSADPVAAAGVEVTPPGAPSLSTPTYNGTLVSVSFSAGSGTNTSYQYSTDDGVSWTSLSGTSSPFTISGLTRGSTYKIKLRGVNESGNGTASEARTFVPVWKPSVPVLGSLSAGSGTISVPFTPSTDDGGATVTYKYRKASSSNGVSFGDYGDVVTVSGGSQVVISGINNDRYYKIEFWAENSSGESATRATATINATRASAPTISTQPLGTNLTIGQAASYTLSVSVSKGREADTLSYQWYKDSNPISSSGTSSTYVLSGDLTGKGGLYKVIVTETANSDVQTVTSNEVTITVNGAPSISTDGTLAAGTAGGTYASVTLAATGGTSPYSTWTSSGTLPSGLSLSSSGVISGTISSSATVGTYTFNVTARDSKSVTTAAKAFTIVVSKGVTITTTSLGNASKGMSPAYSASLNASGGATPYVWSINTSDDNRLPAGLSLAADGTISGTPTDEARSQSFTVKVTDANGAYITGRFTINIVASVPGKTTISSQSAGNKSITLTWSAPTSSAPITSYVINFIKPKGEHNDEGGDDDEEKGSVITPTNATSYTITGLKNGVKYTITVSARTAGGSGAPSDAVEVTTGSVPGGPRSVAIVKSGRGYSIRWAGPEDNGGRSITSWDVQCVKNSDETSVFSQTGLHSGEHESITKSEDSYRYEAQSVNFLAGTSYKCHVRAETPAGKGSWSAYSSALSFSSAPKRPSVVSADATTSPGKAVVTWTALDDSENGGSAITGYVAKLKKNGEGENEHESERYCSTNDSTTTTCTIKGVPTKGTFKISLVARNANGSSEADIEDVVIPGKTQTVTLPTISTKTVGDPDFSFEARTDSGLRLRYSIDPSTSANCERTAKGQIRVKAAGDCKVLVNQDGRSHDREDDGDGEEDSDWAALPTNSVSLTFMINPKAPNAPTIASVTPGNTNIVFVWNAPSSGGAPTAYEFEIKDVTASGAWTTADTATVTSPMSYSKTFTSLTNGHTYNIRIRSYNGGGRSSWVEGSATYVPFTVPNAPVITTSNTSPVKPEVTNATSSVKIEWTLLNSSENGGKAITSYIVTPYLAGVAVNAKKCTTNASTSECTITGLNNNTTYTFKMVATNAAGSSPVSNVATAVIGGVDQTISKGTIPSLYGSTVGDPNIQLNATASSGLPIQYSTSTPTKCAVSLTGSINFISDGLCEINLAQNGKDGADGNGNATKFNAAPSVTPIQLDIKPATPSAPSISSITNGATGLTVVWTAPSRLGGGTISYVVTAALSGTSAQTCTVNEPTRTCVLVGSGHLTKGTAYLITVLAHSDAGDGPSSTAKTGTWMTKPDAPASLTISATSDSSELDRKGIRAVIGKSVSDGGSAISSYTVTATNGGTTLTCTAVRTDATTETCDIHGATAGLTYTTKVTATNAIGTSDETTGSDVVPGVSQSFTPDSNQSLTYAITHADFNAGFTVSSGLAITYSPNNSNCTVSSSGLVHLARIGTCVITVSQSGSGTVYKAATSRTLTITITKVKPAKAVISSTVFDTSTVTIAWTVPSFVGGEGASITGKKVVATGTGGPFYCTPATLADNSCTVTGLTTGSPYSFAVMLDNYENTDAGATAYNEFASTSDSVSVTPVGEDIEAPEPAYATSGTKSIGLNWSTPASNTTGEAITGYVIEMWDGSAWVARPALGLVLSTTITGLNNGQSYKFRIHAKTENHVGHDSYEIIGKTYSVPTAPTSVSVTAGTTTAVINWRAPESNGGTPVTSFRAYSGSNQCTASSETATSCTITGLTPGTTYSFKVYAINDAGNGAETTAADVSTLTAPSAPVLVSTVTEPNTGTVLVTWNKSASNGGASITSYTVKAYSSYTDPTHNTYSGYSCTSTTNLDADTNSCRVSGLAYKTYYKFVVYATTVAGNSDDSNTLDQVKLELTQTITFTITSPVSYLSTSQNLNGTSSSGLAVTYSTSTASVCEIASGIVTYKSLGTCILTAVQSGDSRYLEATSVPREISITASAPDAPTLTQVTPGANKLTATWSAPTQLGGSTISTYILSWAKNADFSDESSVSTNTTSYAINGLDAGINYRVRVRVITTGYSDGSVWSNVLTGTPFGAPKAPEGVTAVNAGTGLATVSYNPPSSHADWSDSADNGSLAITGFTVAAYESTGVTTTGQRCSAGPTESSCVISGLNGSINYVFKATSYNSVGSATSLPSSSYSAGITQTISVATPAPEITHGATPFAISDYVSVDSGLPLSYTLVETTADNTWPTTHHACTFDPSTGLVTVDAAGTCTFTVTQNGKDAAGLDTAYLPATTKTQVITVLAVVPDVVPTTIVYSPDSEKLTVTWTEPLDDGGAPITGYKIVWYKKVGGTAPTGDGGSTWAEVSSGARTSGILRVASTARSQILSGLENGTTYYIFVYAQNRKGFGL